jgi:dolichyl-phosphate-mannose--protein O-mannosyl transferase
LLPPLLALLGTGLSLSPVIDIVMFSFIAWPALLWTHYNFWTNRRACCQTKSRKNLDRFILVFSSALFIAILFTSYIPALQGNHQKTLVYRFGKWLEMCEPAK